ncbi:hypothetical protein INH39_21460 [Massilia violaceinigra]|uniref:Uncharacterized protein n=1 Tax=Massilia violaceinigra TaxID=2045208 RepID=A0ABY4A386_9BURK|nr:hypothetical protein [Massilia violaceinigra]UOD28031.1 hypothetical protein INH39_21460 [Massilia violaceinigra]
MTENPETAKVSLQDGPFLNVQKTEINSQSLTIVLEKDHGLYLYAFNSRMFLSHPHRTGAERFIFEGPRLGLYYDTADPREGPFVNHHINRVDIHLDYLSADAVRVNIDGSADLAKSSVDEYWYKGARSGTWKFTASFIHQFPPEVSYKRTT